MLTYCVSADLNLYNVGNKPTFRTKTREEVLNLTLVNRRAWDRAVGWHVSNVLSFFLANQSNMRDRKKLPQHEQTFFL